jgi:transcription factor SPN1
LNDTDYDSLGRRRALDKKMDEAVRSYKPNRRRRGGDIDIDKADDEIETMRHKMAKACEDDAAARSRGQIATHKLAILPQVVELMNRNTIQTQIVDPDINLLEAVRFMLEPADHDAALPNYKIQRELFNILIKLNIGKEALVASGIGKVVLFYTKSTQPQPEIKRMAEKLVGEWMRVVLKKHKTKRAVPVPTQTYDPLAASARSGISSQGASQAVLAERRRKMLAAPSPGNRARVEGGVSTYTIAPVNTLSNAHGVSSRKLGASGEDAFRKIAARGAVKAGNASSGRK